MAILKSDDLSFDFRYTGFQWGWVKYQFYFLWKNEPIVNDAMLKKQGEYWGARPTGAFLANEHEEDYLLPVLKRVLETDKADYWEALEPDIIVALYPEDYFPFLPSHLKRIYRNEEEKAQHEEQIRLNKEKGKSPDDPYTFIAFVDAYNFKDSDMYYGQGLSLQMIVNRSDLEQFVIDLEKEYDDFKTRFKDDDYWQSREAS